MKIRDLEIFKGSLAIAKVIGDDVYNDILSFGIEYVKEIKEKDLTDDWGYLTFEYIVKKFEECKISDPKISLEFPVNEIAMNIHKQLYYDLPPRDKDRKIHQLRKFIGSKLKGYQFKKTRPHNCAIYHINAIGLIRILDIKNMLGLFKERLGLLGLLGKKDQKKLDVDDTKKPVLSDRISELKDYFQKLQSNYTKISRIALIHAFDEEFIELVERDKLIGSLPDGFYEWWGK